MRDPGGVRTGPLFLRSDVVNILRPDAGIPIVTFTLVAGLPAVQAITVALDMQTGAFILPDRVVLAPTAGVTARPVPHPVPPGTGESHGGGVP